MRRERGQALIEFALVFPLMMLMLLGIAGVFYRGFAQYRMQEGISNLADWAVRDSGGWQSRVNKENQRVRCNASPLQPDIVEDATSIELTWHCHMTNADWVFGLISPDITVSSKAVKLAPAPTPVPTPSSAPSPSP